jgi:hypothetical protein
MNRLQEILEDPLASILEHERRIAPDMLEQDAADEDVIGICGLFDARGDIDAVAHQVIAPHDNVREM